MSRIFAVAVLVFVAAHTAAAQTDRPPRAPRTPVVPRVPTVPLPPAVPAPPAFPQFETFLPPDPPDVFVDFDPGMFADLNVSLAGLDRIFDDVNLAFAQQPFPQPPSPPTPPSFRGSQEEASYEQARGLIERDQYDRAVQAFDRVIERRGTRTDAAMYWKAYSLSKLSRTSEALSVLGDLQKQFAASPWVRDARALEVEVKQQAGQSVAADATDDEVKLLALRGLMQNDADAGVAIVEKMLAGNASVRVKDRALFVLSQSRSARAREVIAGVAKGASNPDLRLRAIRYLGMRSDAESRQLLDEVYRSSNDAEIKRAIIRSFTMSGASGNTERLAQIARTEKDPELQQSAIRTLGMIGQSDASDALRAIYASDVPLETKKTVIDALMMRQNAAALVALARAERNPTLKTEIVRRLSTMRSPEARDYMLELLK